MTSLVTVKIFNDQVDLHLAKSFLESEGIECFIQDQYIVEVNPFVTNAVNGMKLQVVSENVSEAIRLLIEGGFAKEEDYEIPEGMQRTVKIVDWLKNIF